MTSRATLRALKHAPTPRETYDLTLTGRLEGFHLTMGAMSGRQIVGIQRGTINEADVLEMVAERCISHNFEEESLLDLDFWIIGEILDAWKVAMEEKALPPQKGAS
jgi:hypothetical protein